MDDDDDPLERERGSRGTRPRRAQRARVLATVLVVALGCALVPVLCDGAYGGEMPAPDGPAGPGQVLSLSVLMVVGCLLAMSAFFSSCETAFLSIDAPRIRSMRESYRMTARLVAKTLDNPGRLLTTILVGNMLVNTLIGVVLGTRVKDLFEYRGGLSAPASYAAAIAVTTGVLLFFGEILPKVFAVRAQDAYARVAVLPLVGVGRALAPLRNGLLRLTDFLFRVTRFHELRAAPFITDQELKSVFANGQSEGVIEEDGREMIRRILDFHDAQLREILVPRPDIVAVPEDATVAEALGLYREHEFSRVPVFRDDLDHITGVLYAKDTLPSVTTGELARPVKTLVRPAHFVPETMSVQDFIKHVQRLRSHLAIAVDEFGGTEGIVTLQDAIEKVVGDITVEDEEAERLYEQVGQGVYRVMGSMPLDEFSELTGIAVEDEEHQTMAGYLMDKTEKVPAVGDHFSHAGISFTVEEVDGKRASTMRIEVPREDEEDAP